MAVTQKLTLTQVSQDPQNLTSQVRILWTSTQTGGSYNETRRTAYCYISVNGGAEQTVQLSYILPYQSTTTLLDKEVTVEHNSAGNGSIKVRTWMNTNISAGVVELSKTLQLTQIPVQSTIAAADGTIGSTVRLAVTRHNTNYTHSIAYSFGSESGYVTENGGISQSQVCLAKENVDFLLPESFYSQIPNSKKGICTLTLLTYDGDQQIGQPETASFTVSTDPQLAAPGVDGTVADVCEQTLALTGDSAVLIRYHSTARCTILPTPGPQATVSDKLVCGQAVSGSVLDFPQTERKSYTFTVRDSRGYEATKTVQCQLLPYIRLTCRATVKRDGSTGSTATLTVSGELFNNSFGAKSNTLTLKYQVGSGEYVEFTPVCSGNTYTATTTLTELDYERSYRVTVVAQDALETLTQELNLHRGQPVFDWGEGNFTFHVPVLMEHPLEIGQGGTGTTDAASARYALEAAHRDLTDATVTCTSFQQLEDGIAQVYDQIGNGGSRYFLFSVNDLMYDVRIWRATAKYGAAYISSYAGPAQRRCRMLSAGVWQEWEWPDPPMVLDTEYRTTQRWRNKPVYTKLISIGPLPNNTSVSVPHGATATQVIRAEGQTSGGRSFPVCGPHFYSIGLRAGVNNVEISTDYDYSNLTGTVQIWYTKE